jgi:hypothetical protein
MLPQLYEYRPVLFERAECSFGASQVACLEFLGVLWIVVAFQDLAVTVRSSSQILDVLRKERAHILSDVQDECLQHSITPLRCCVRMLCIVAHGHCCRADCECTSSNQ